MMNDDNFPQDDLIDSDFLESSDDTDTPPSLDESIAEMKIINDDLPSDKLLYGLANITPEEGENQLKAVWQARDVAYRRILLQTLIEITELEYQYEYQTMGEIALVDDDDIIRKLAIELLADLDNLSLMKKFMNLAQTDPFIGVRIEAIRALGNFIHKGELLEIPEEKTAPARELVMSFLTDKTLANATLNPIGIRSVALESISRCSDPRIAALIQEAYQSHDEILRRSAIIAMGNSCDERWSDIVLEELENDDEDIRLEAAKASGMLEIADAIPYLERMIADTDRAAQIIAINALAEIGGERAVYLLEQALQTADEMEDDDMLELIENAMTEAQFMSGYSLFDDLDLLDD